MSGKRYGPNQTYHGRRGGSAALKALVTVLAILLVVGLIFLLLMGRYIQYTDDGVKLVLPWLQEEQPTQRPNPDVSAIIVTEQPTPTPTPEAGLPTLTAVEVTAGEITGGTAAALAQQAGANALVVTVKNEEGDLTWDSALPLALEEMDGDPAFNQAVADLSQAGELYLVARLPAFRDLWASVYHKEMALVTPSGAMWYDSSGISWMSAASPTAQEYITALCLELAELGFDEILLEDAAFPASGRLSAIAQGDRYPATGREEAVSAFVSALAETLEERGTNLALRAGGTVLTGSDPAGVTLTALTSVGRVWLDSGEDPAAWQTALTQAGMEEAEARLVLTGQAPAGTLWTGSQGTLTD